MSNSPASNVPISPAFAPSLNGDLLNRTSLLRFIREWARAHSIGEFYTMEFGVLNGEGTVDILRQLRAVGYTAHFGFDSFEGFGEIGTVDTEKLHLQPNFHAGAFHGLDMQSAYQSIKSHTRFDADLVLVPGFFEKTLKEFDKSKLKGFPLLLYVDCDLHQSSKECFDFIEDIAQSGTWILCDDYWCYRGHPNAGQRRALDEWVGKSKRVGVTSYCNFFEGPCRPAFRS